MHVIEKRPTIVCSLIGFDSDGEQTAALDQPARDWRDNSG